MSSSTLVPVAVEPNTTAVAPLVADPTMQTWLTGQLSRHTHDAYRRDIQQYLAWLETREGVATWTAATREHIIHYRNYLTSERHLAAASVARKLSAISQAYDTAVAEGLIERNPAALVKRPRVPAVSPRHALANATVRLLLAEPDRTTVQGARDYAILHLLLYCGLRREEVAVLRCGWFAEERGHRALHVHGKGQKERILAIRPDTWQAVSEYMALDGRGSELQQGTDEPLFRPTHNHVTGTTAKTLSVSQVWRVVRGIAERAGLGHLDVHTLRHTALTSALDGGATVRHVQAMAGHADPKTTMRYDHNRGNLDHSAVYRVNYG